MVTGLYHYGRTVSDIKAVSGFFSKYFGFREKLYRENVDAPYLGRILAMPECRMNMLFMEGQGLSVELFEFLSPLGEKLDCRTVNTGSTHLCFTVDDIFPLYEEMKRDGVRMISGGPVLIESGNHAGGYALYLMDPDDSVIELIQLP